MKNPDSIYLEFSKFAYKTDIKDSYIPYKVNGELQYWHIMNDKKYTLTDPETGFDATIIKNGDEIIVAFRGTEPDNGFKRAIKDLGTDIEHILFGASVEVKEPITRPKGPLGKLPIEIDKKETNQFIQANELIKDMKKDYPNANITVTGHSLGGALAQFVAAIHELSAVTYSAPTVIDLLPKEVKNKALAGKFDSTIINFVHPKDSIGAGPFGPWYRHVGATFYIGTKFEYENWRDNPLSRFFSSVSNYHDMKHYKFDAKGYLNNPVIYNVLTGTEEYTSPRYAAAYGGTIEVLPEDLREAAKLLKKTGESLESDSRFAKAIFQQLLIDDAKCSQTLDAGHQLVACLQKLHNFAEKGLPELAYKLEQAADDYNRADKLA